VYRKGCTPPDSVAWANGDNNKQFLAQNIVMTPKLMRPNTVSNSSVRNAARTASRSSDPALSTAAAQACTAP
jgi:hypothetical protein